jgi:cysteine desulfurase/selenocysteine lyase
MAYDIEKIRADFPILSREVHGKPLVYLDNGASAQKPKAVIDAVSNVYSNEYANVHRGLHYLSMLQQMHMRNRVKAFVNL